MKEGSYDDRVDMVSIRARALLDEETVGSFFGFLIQDSKLMVEPEKILNSWQDVRPQLSKLTRETPIRTDVLAMITNRLSLHLTSEQYRPLPGHKTNLEAFLTDGVLPEDLTLSVVQQLMHTREEIQQLILSDRIYNQIKDLWPEEAGRAA